MAEDECNYNGTNEWANFANVDEDSTELVIGINNAKPDNYEKILHLINKNGGEPINTISIEGEVWAVVADIPLAEVSSFVTETQAAGFSRYMNLI